MALPQNSGNVSTSSSKGNYKFAFILVTSLFFLWGLAYGLLDVLNKHFQDILKVDKAHSALLQTAYFGAYFLIALPAGFFMTKFGYKKGVIFGLLLYAIGAFMFYPSSQALNFNFFLVSLFILASGLAFLETAANPYVTVLGDSKSAAFRLNLAQSFNGVGSFIGPIIAAKLFFGTDANNLDSVKMVYLIIGATVLIIAGLFWRTKLPEIREVETMADKSLDKKPLFQHKNFTRAIITQFFYVGAQVGIAALFINYCTEAVKGISNEKAAILLSVSLLLFTIGRFVGTTIMKKIEAPKLLFYYSIINIVLTLVIVFLKSELSVYALMAIFFFESIMFPTIFALGIKDLGHHTKKGSSFIIMSIVGGAIMPYIMGLVAERYGIATAYIIPTGCFVITAWYGLYGHRVQVTS